MRKSIKARVGTAFSIKLESSPTSGYQWSASADSAMLRLVTHDIRPSRSIGGSAEEEFLFEPLQAGQTTVTLTYKRPWDSAVEKTLVVTVNASS